MPTKQQEVDTNTQAVYREIVHALAVEMGIVKEEKKLSPPKSSLEMAENFRHFPCAIPDFHKLWYEALDNGPSHLLLLAPRESAKTSVVLTHVLFRLVTDRQTRVILVSKSEGHAKALLRELTHEMETNRPLIEAVGRLKPQNTVRWSTNEIVIEGANHGKDASCFAVGVGGQLTGRRADLLVLDDVETVETVLTPESRARTREWFAREASAVLAPGGKMVVVGTRKAEADLYGYLMTTDGLS